MQKLIVFDQQGTYSRYIRKTLYRHTLDMHFFKRMPPMKKYILNHEEKESFTLVFLFGKVEDLMDLYTIYDQQMDVVLAPTDKQIFENIDLMKKDDMRVLDLNENKYKILEQILDCVGMSL